MNNPINFIDPDGRAAISVNGPNDWVYGKIAGEISLGWERNSCNGRGFKSNKYEYVGASTNDVATQYKEINPITSLVSDPKFIENITPLHTMVHQKENTWLEDWSSGDSSLKKMAYDVGNSYYLVAQAVDGDLLGENFTNPVTGARAYTNIDGSTQYDVGERTLNFH